MLWPWLPMFRQVYACQKQVEPEMRNQKGRHQHFDSCQSRQKVLAKMLAPLFRLSVLLISGAYMLEHCLHKDACAAGGVKYAEVRADLAQPIPAIKARTQ